MQSQKDLLDQLMGAARNDGENTKVVRENFKGQWICKNYLMGFCPYEVFKNTKLDYGRGSCGK